MAKSEPKPLAICKLKWYASIKKAEKLPASKTSLGALREPQHHETHTAQALRLSHQLCAGDLRRPLVTLDHPRSGLLWKEHLWGVFRVRRRHGDEHSGEPPGASGAARHPHEAAFAFR